MTTFVSKNYEGLAPKDEAQKPVAETPIADNKEVKEEAPASGLSEVKITIVGPISEIVAKALNAVFKNNDAIEYSEESRNDLGNLVVSLSTENTQLSKDINVYCVDLESINKDPTGEMLAFQKFSLECDGSLFAYVATNKSAVTKSQESWFINNASSVVSGVFFSQESLFRYIRGNS